jgi:hypothetical protein
LFGRWLVQQYRGAIDAPRPVADGTAAACGRGVRIINDQLTVPRTTIDVGLFIRRLIGIRECLPTLKDAEGGRLAKVKELTEEISKLEAGDAKQANTLARQAIHERC